MKTFSVNSKQFKAENEFEKLNKLCFKSSLSYMDVDFSTNTRSITDLIVFCIGKNLSEKDIASKFNIDLISVQGKVNPKKKDGFFELKNKKIVLTEIGKERFVLIPNE